MPQLKEFIVTDPENTAQIQPLFSEKCSEIFSLEFAPRAPLQLKRVFASVSRFNFALFQPEINKIGAQRLLSCVKEANYEEAQRIVKCNPRLIFQETKLAIHVPCDLVSLKMDERVKETYFSQPQYEPAMYVLDDNMLYYLKHAEKSVLRFRLNAAQRQEMHELLASFPRKTLLSEEFASIHKIVGHQHQQYVVITTTPLKFAVRVCNTPMLHIFSEAIQHNHELKTLFATQLKEQQETIHFGRLTIAYVRYCMTHREILAATPENELDENQKTQIATAWSQVSRRQKEIFLEAGAGHLLRQMLWIGPNWGEDIDLRPSNWQADKFPVWREIGIFNARQTLSIETVNQELGKKYTYLRGVIMRINNHDPNYEYLVNIPKIVVEANKDTLVHARFETNILRSICDKRTEQLQQLRQEWSLENIAAVSRPSI